MKKLLIIMVIIAIIIVSLQIVIINKISSVEVNLNKDVDSIINKVQIDSIELVIKEKDSTIVHIKNTIRDEIDKANALNDSSSLELFERLVSE
jgi:hypothetical protein